MRLNAMVHVGLALVAVLVQAGCNKDTGPTQDVVAPEKTTGARGGDSGVTRTAKLPANTVTLPEGTPLTVRTTTALSTNTQEAGQTFTAHLEKPLVYGGREIAPNGAVVQGRIVEADKGGRVKDRASLAVQLTRLHTAGGHVVEISTSTITREARATKGKDAAKIGIGSGVGAAIGAIAGGGKGAAIGAAAGAGAGTGVVLATHGDPAVIPSESVLDFALSAPVTVAELR
ncbi:MAG TPA: hypothetical protein VLE22_27045 [Bryobacteraceae bacterium]|nr:hypothetical protein [Bryobacteraceae bacterium]